MADLHDPAATVTVSLASFRAMETELKRLRDENAAHARNAQPTPADEAIATDALRAALPVVQFAVGNLDPRTVRGWPHDALAQLAEVIDTALPGDPHTDVMAISFREFAREAAYWDKFRDARHKTAEKILGIDDADEAREGNNDAVVDEVDETP